MSKITYGGVINFCKITKDRPVNLPDLPGNPQKGKVVTRFPPEASGYLHLGHIKALLHNYLYAKKYEGKIILRFDDTNPDKEKELFEQAIKEDIVKLGLTCDSLTHASDYFHLIDVCAQQLISKHLAYMDFSTDEEIGKQRATLVPSPFRDSSIEDNLREFDLLMKGEKTSGCLRAKIDYRNVNGCLRDPVLYRYKEIIHPRNPNRKAFPTYDFSCPLLDKIQGVTHAMRSIEYQGRDNQYKWFLKYVDLLSILYPTANTSLNTSLSTSCDDISEMDYKEVFKPLLMIRKKQYRYEKSDLELVDPIPMSYGRLNFTNTVLSKRKLGKLVDLGLTSGWDDPRMPTLRGILRAGMEIEPLIAYITTQVLSKVPVTLEWSKVWTINSAYLNTRARRFYGIGPNIIEVILQGALPESIVLPNHPTIPEMGNRTLPVSNTLYVDAEDFPDSVPINSRFTLVGLGNATLTSKSPLILQFLSDDRDFKSTLKVTWLPKNPKNSDLIKVKVKRFGPLLTKAKLEDDDDVVSVFNKDSESVYELLLEPAISDLFNSTVTDRVFQIMRKGYFYLDSVDNGNIVIHGPTQ